MCGYFCLSSTSEIQEFRNNLCGIGRVYFVPDSWGNCLTLILFRKDMLVFSEFLTLISFDFCVIVGFVFDGFLISVDEFVSNGVKELKGFYPYSLRGCLVSIYYLWMVTDGNN